MRNTSFAICRSKKDRDLLVQKGKNYVCFSRTELRSGTFKRPCRPQTTIRFPRVGVSVWRGAGDCCMHGTTGSLQITGKTICCYTQTGNGNHLKSRVMSKDTARMFAGWVVATRHLPRNLRYAHLSRPYQKLFPSLCTVVA
jgi:hypothetical protein